MAQTRTTLSSAVTTDDREIVVASATGFAAGNIVRVDQEYMVVQKSYSSGTTIPVRRGQIGSGTAAHVVTAGVAVWDPTVTADNDAPGLSATTNNMIAGRPRRFTSITADNSTVTHAPAGSDHYVELNSTSVINLTVPVPTHDMNGDELVIYGNGTAAHVVTFTGGLGGEGAAYDVLTFNASGPVAAKFVALNAVWLVYTQPAWTGTVTNLVAAIA